MENNIMRVCKDKDNPYILLNKEFLMNNKLSLKAKGLLTYLLSLPDNWKIYVNELTNNHKDGRDSITSAINELIENNYIVRKKIIEKGKYNYILEVTND